MGRVKNAMLKRINAVVERFAVAWINCFRRFFKNGKIIKIAVLGPASEGSLGDEALLEVFISECRKRFPSAEITLFCWSRNDQWKNFSDAKKSYCLINYIFRESIVSELQVLAQMSLYDHFVCIGADVLDGFYCERASLGFFRAAQLMQKIKLTAGIINFSFNRRPTAGVKAVLSGIPEDIYLIARDQKSKAHMAGLANRRVELGCDLAFLLEPLPGGAGGEYAAWIGRRRESGGLVVGININMHPFNDTDIADDIEGIVRRYAALINSWLAEQPGLSVLLMPHDYRGRNSDLKLCEQVDAALDEQYRERKKIVSGRMTAGGIKALCRNLDFCLTGRFHLAIACLSQGVPAMAINYQDKMPGIYNDLGVEALLIEPAVFLDEAGFKARFRDCFDGRELFAERLRANVPRLKERALVNFLYVG